MPVINVFTYYIIYGPDWALIVFHFHSVYTPGGQHSGGQV